MEKTIGQIMRMMAPMLSEIQLGELNDVLFACLCGKGRRFEMAKTSEEHLADFLSAKRLEGCSERSLEYYSGILNRFIAKMHKPVNEISTDDIRTYLAEYPMLNGAGKVTVDNVRRVISSFFSWLEAEDRIYKSPVRRIKKIRSSRVIRPVYSDEALETLRDACEESRDLALIDFLASTGIRVGELVRLNRNDVNFETRECVVRGKGDKERVAYFDARAKTHLQSYLSCRSDSERALFVSLGKPCKRLEISGVESRLRKLGRKAGIEGVHPHKFRRTLATKAIDKGMPIEQVQMLLGHSKIDTTLCYAMVDQGNVKRSHHKYIS